MTKAPLRAVIITTAVAATLAAAGCSSKSSNSGTGGATSAAASAAASASRAAPAGSSSAAAVTLVDAAHAKGVKVIAYDRPIPKAKVDYYVSFDNEAIGKAISQSLVQQLKKGSIPSGSGILEVNGSPTDAAAGLIKKGI